VTVTNLIQTTTMLITKKSIQQQLYEQASRIRSVLFYRPAKEGEHILIWEYGLTQEMASAVI
jgi:hypothetical protein